jgi:hypothetical protein
MGTPTPFSLRLTTSICVFNCLFIASPQGAQTFVFGNAAIISALQLEYAQLVTLYMELRQQDIPSQEVVLDGLIASALTTVTALLATLNTIVETGDAGILLRAMQSVVTSAVANLKNVQSDE